MHLVKSNSEQQHSQNSVTRRKELHRDEVSMVWTTRQESPQGQSRNSRTPGTSMFAPAERRDEHSRERAGRRRACPPSLRSGCVSKFAALPHMEDAQSCSAFEEMLDELRAPML